MQLYIGSVHILSVSVLVSVSANSEFRNLDFLLTFVCVHLLTANKIYQNKVLGKNTVLSVSIDHVHSARRLRRKLL